MKTIGYTLILLIVVSTFSPVPVLGTEGRDPGNTYSTAEIVKPGERRDISANSEPSNGHLSLPQFYQIIVTGTRELRLRAVEKASQGNQDTNASPEVRKFSADIFRFRFKVEQGETTPEEFEFYCRAADRLIAEYDTVAAEHEVDSEISRNFRRALRLAVGNPYLGVDDWIWRRVKFDLKARQKWAAPKEASVPEFFGAINTDSREERFKVVQRVGRAIMDTKASPEIQKFAGDLSHFKMQVVKGETHPSDFALYCRTIEVLITDITIEKLDEKLLWDYDTAISLLIDNSYRGFDQWHRDKKLLEERQKWAAPGKK